MILNPSTADVRPQDRSIPPRPGDVPSAFDRLTLGSAWCHDLHAAGVDVYGRPIGGAA